MPTAPQLLHHYAIVRTDVALRDPAAFGVSIGHAAGNSSTGNLPDETHFILLAQPDEAALEEVSRRLSWEGLAHRRIVEDRGPWAGQLLAIGIPPAPRDELRRHLSSLPLWRPRATS